MASTPFEFADVLPGLCRRELLRRSGGVVLPAARGRRVARDVPDDGPRSATRTSCRTTASSGGCSGSGRSPERYEIVHRTLYPVHQRVAARVSQGPRFSRGRCGAPQQSARRHGHERRHTRRVQPGREARARRTRRGGAAAELDRYERQRRPIALEYVNTISHRQQAQSRDPRSGGAATLARGTDTRRGGPAARA